jgi:hypothetical protein
MNETMKKTYRTFVNTSGRDIHIVCEVTENEGPVSWVGVTIWVGQERVVEKTVVHPFDAAYQMAKEYTELLVSAIESFGG